MDRFDLHTHTSASDGLHRPAEVVRMAREAGLSGLAVTDHDTLAGIREALDAGVRFGVRVIPGIEISTFAEGKDIHILGYGILPDHPLFSTRLAALRERRLRRNEAIVARLNERGIPITMAEVEQTASASAGRDGRSIGRPHIAEVLVRKGLAEDIRDAFDRYLAEGAAAYVPFPRIGPAEAVRWIQEAGGAAIVAHPGLYGNDRLVQELLDGGADGLEAFHSDHDEAAARRYREMAESRGKLVTGGSDFHGVRDGTAFHGPLGGRTVDGEAVERLLNRAGPAAGLD